ncbi:hypothetical protein GN316_13980 [Xylophilus sp. Kf1]|nr:hypothetical protein [Xylophilus sp. Kf1]
MQPFLSSLSLPAGSSGASAGWPVTGGRDRHGVASNGTVGADAGVGLLRRRADDGDPPPLDMQLGEDLQALLQIRPEPEGTMAQGGFDAAATPPIARRAARAVQSTVEALRQAFSVEPGVTVGAAALPESLVGQYAALWHLGPIARSPDRDIMMAARAADMLAELGRRGEPIALLEQVRSGIDAIRKASDLLERRAAVVHRRLDKPDAGLRDRLDAAGLDSDAVRLGLHRSVNRLICSAVRLAAHGKPVFTLLPGSGALLDMAVHEAGRQAAADTAAADETTDRAPVTRRMQGAQGASDGTGTRVASEPGVAAESRAAALRASGFADPGTGGPAAPIATTATATVTAAPAALPSSAVAVAVEVEVEKSLARLKDFESRWRSLLWQFSGTAEQAARLSMGQVDFPDTVTLASTFPCAVDYREVSQHSRIDRFGPKRGDIVRHRQVPVYPRGTGPCSTVEGATVNGLEVTVRRDDTTGMVVVRGRDQFPVRTDYYTDATVEAAKLAMWTRIFREAFTRSVPQ